MQRTFIGFIELLITSVIWGITYTVLKIALEYVNSFDVAFLRFFVASIFFIPIIFIKKEKYTFKGIFTLIMLGATGVFLYQTLFIMGESGVSAGVSSFIVSTEPIFIYALSLAIHDEKLGIFPISGIALSTIGLIVLIQPSDTGPGKLFYVALVISAAISWAIFTIAGKNILTKHDSLHVTSISSILGTLFLFPFAGFSSLNSLIHGSTSFIISILFLGVGATFLGYILWFDGLKFVKPSIAGVTLYITPFITVFSATIMIGEPLTSLLLLGGVLIIMGIAISNIGGIKG